MKIKNIGNKIIGLGETTVLPNEIAKVPPEFEHSPILDIYVKCNLAEIIDEPAEESAEGDKAVVDSGDEVEKKVTADEEWKKFRQSCLDALPGISEENLGKMAKELGINPADCKNQADVLKKVKAALK